MNKPIKLNGIWNEGYALDYHTISSEYLGEDPFGKNILIQPIPQLGNYYTK